MKHPLSAAILGARKHAVAARLLKRMPCGSVLTQSLAPAASKKARRVEAAVRRIFRLGADLLGDGEWAELFAGQAPQHDLRWLLLARLATQPEDGEGDLRGEFVALPDGTAFSMRLLLTDMRGGDRGARKAKEGGQRFNRLPDAARLLCLLRALRRLSVPRRVEPKPFAIAVEAEANSLGLGVEGLTGKDVTGRLFTKIRNGDGGHLLPTVENKGRGRKRRGGTSQESADG
jgi:hypothetical protein